MKKTIFCVIAGLLALASLPSCGKSDDNGAASDKKGSAVASKDAAYLPNFRFIDTDTIMLKYNLSIDFTEQMIRQQNALNEEEKRQSSIIQSRANALQAKMNAAQTQSDVDALKTEYDNIQNLQAQAQQKLAQMAMDIENQSNTNAQTVMDSLSNFLRDYAAKRGYDAVFVKNCAPYYDAALDVTDEVVEGLNARYNKVKK